VDRDRRHRRVGAVCEDRRVQPQRYTAILAAGSRGRLFVLVPFDPDQVWRPKPQHHITGTINGVGRALHRQRE
jgi:hypothetical protein